MGDGTVMPRKPPQLTQQTTKQREDFRPSASRRGYTRRWARYSKTYLVSNPLCRECLAAGRTTAARLVDHILPAYDHPELFWEESNHQPLCRECHATKTAQEKRFRETGVLVETGGRAGVHELQWVSPSTES